MRGNALNTGTPQFTSLPCLFECRELNGRKKPKTLKVEETRLCLEQKCRVLMEGRSIAAVFVFHVPGLKIRENAKQVEDHD